MHTFRQGRKVYHGFSKLGMEFDPFKKRTISSLNCHGVLKPPTFCRETLVPLE